MIPKVIHYCWFGHNPLPPLAIKCIESWRKYLPDGLTAAVASGTIYKNSPQGSALYFLERSAFRGIGLRNRIASYYNYWRFYRLCRMPSPVIRPTWRMRWLGWPVYVLCAVIKRG